MIQFIAVGLGLAVLSLVSSCQKPEKKEGKKSESMPQTSNTECYSDKPDLRQCVISDVKKARDSLQQLLYQPNGAAGLLFLKSNTLKSDSPSSFSRDEELHQKIKDAKLECVEMYLAPGGDRCRYDHKNDYLSLMSALSLFEPIEKLRSRKEELSSDQQEILRAYEDHKLQVILRRPDQTLIDRGYPDIILSAGILKKLFPDLPSLAERELSEIVKPSS